MNPSLTLKLAWRSFRRHRRRSIITVSAISLSLAMMIIFVGIADDSHARMAELGIRMGAGHVLVQGNGYQAEETLDHLVPSYGKLLQRVRALPSVTEAVPRVRTTGLLSAGEKSAPVLVSGVDPKREPAVSTIPDKRRRVAGEYLRAPADMPFKNMPMDIFIGLELAKTLEVEVGDRVVLTVSPRESGRPAQAAFVVCGTFRTGVMELDQAWVEVPLAESQRLLNLKDEVTQVALLLDAMEKSLPVARALDAELPADLEVLAWEQALKELFDAIVLDDAGMYLMMAIIFIIVAIGIFNAVLMSVVERTREFGVMMALGQNSMQLFAVVLTEAVILAVVSAIFGVIVGLGLHAWVLSVGIDIGAMAGDYQIAGIVMEGKIYSKLTAWIVTKWTLVVMGLVLAAAIYPALRAARLNPLEAMHHV